MRVAFPVIPFVHADQQVLGFKYSARRKIASSDVDPDVVFASIIETEADMLTLETVEPDSIAPVAPLIVRELTDQPDHVTVRTPVISSNRRARWRSLRSFLPKVLGDLEEFCSHRYVNIPVPIDVIVVLGMPTVYTVLRSHSPS